MRVVAPPYNSQHPTTSSSGPSCCVLLSKPGKHTRNVLRIRMYHNTRGPMIHRMVLGLANSTLSDINRAFHLLTLRFLNVNLSSCNLPLDNNMTTPGITSSWERFILSADFVVVVCLFRREPPETSE